MRVHHVLTRVCMHTNGIRKWGLNWTISKPARPPLLDGVSLECTLLDTEQCARGLMIIGSVRITCCAVARGWVGDSSQIPQVAIAKGPSHHSVIAAFH